MHTDMKVKTPEKTSIIAFTRELHEGDPQLGYFKSLCPIANLGNCYFAVSFVQSDGLAMYFFNVY